MRLDFFPATTPKQLKFRAPFVGLRRGMSAFGATPAVAFLWRGKPARQVVDCRRALAEKSKLQIGRDGSR